MNYFISLLFLIAFANFVSAKANEEDMLKEFVPQWAKTVVWYQIFPERFSNGDPGNDPTLDDQKGAWPHDTTSPWQIHPWNSDWYKLQPYEQVNGKGFGYNVIRRRYGGDLQGIINKLDYLQELGINAIYLNPIFESPSLHKYDGASYHHVDPNFGPDPKGDRELIKQETPDDPSTWVWTSADKLFLKLVEEVHERGMKIIIDGVFNHMGINSFAFRDIEKNQQNSKYKDWFEIKSFADPVKGTKFIYNGWFGVAELPEIKEDDNGIVEGPKEYIFAATRRWMDPDNNRNLKKGIDGWRLDVAFCVKHPFWKDWRNVVKSINPEAYLTAEIIDPIPIIKPYLEGDEFDAVMNYNFLFTCSEYFVDPNNKLITSDFDTLLKELRNAFPEGVDYVQQNLIGSHDSQRILSHIVNKDLGRYRNWGEHFGLSKAENPKYNVRKPDRDEIKILKLITLFQFTYVGAPMIYYGDEAGMWGANDPDCRKPMVWKENVYEDEIYNRDQSKRSPDKVEFNSGLFEHYKKLIGIRNKFSALQTGSFETLITDDDKNVYGFARKSDSQNIVVLINNNEMSSILELEIEGKYKDVLNSDEIFESIDGSINLKLDALWGRILVKE